jgi:hypothetical protein
MEKIEGGRLVVEALKKGGIPTVAISAGRKSPNGEFWLF